MAYRPDVDLEFLEKVSSEDLNQLVYILTHDLKDGEVRWTEELTNNRAYITAKPDHHQYWREIAAEVQCFGAHTISTIFRGGKGVLYRKILMDVCDSQKVNYNKKSDTRVIEKELLSKILDKAWGTMTEEERASCTRGMRGMLPKGIFAELAGLALMQALLDMGGIVGLRMATTAASFVAPAALTASGLVSAAFMPVIATAPARLLGGALLAPLLAVLTAAQIAGGPAYRVTIPSCVLVATLRGKYELSAEDMVSLKKTEELLKKFRGVIDAYSSSDKRLAGIYFFACIVSREINSTMTDSDIQDSIFGSVSDEFFSRAKEYLPSESSSPETTEVATRFAIVECGCGKENVRVFFESILEYSQVDPTAEEDVRRRFEAVMREL